nr:EAL domain-containing protein [uncultured Noviherbaspirillum sp.]
MAILDALFAALNPAEKLRFARRIAPQLVVWVIGALVVAAFKWAIFFSVQETAREEARQAAVQATASFADRHADRLYRTFDSMNQMMHHVQLEWALSDGRMKIDDMRRYWLFASPSLYYVTIFNSSGMPVLTSLPKMLAISVTDRPYFSAHQSAQVDKLFIGAPTIGRASKINVIQLSRRLADKDNAFAGVVALSIVETLFTANYDAIVLGRKGLLGFISVDNRVMVARIGDQTSQAERLQPFLQPTFNGPAGSALVDGSRFADGRSRFVAWQSVKGYPLMAFAGLDAEEALASFESRYQNSKQNALWASLVLALFTLMAMLFTTERAWRKHQLSITSATYRLATEQGSEGIYIYQPVFDRNGVIIDFRITDCNHRAAEFFRLERDALINRTVSSFRTGIKVQAFMAWLVEAWERGFYDSEIRVPRGSALQLHWAEIKILRSNDLLALRLRDISQAKEHLTELERRSEEDFLTGLPNRHWVQHYLPQAIAAAKAGNRRIALLFIDLDGFKKVNDTAGHPAGDEVLRHAAERLREATRPDDKVVRFGGDEFVVVLENIEGREDGAHVAQRVQKAFSQPFRTSENVHTVGTSIGISIFPDDGLDAQALLEKADIAMYSVKTSGKHGYQYYESKFYHALRERLEKEAELRLAVERNEFVMLYQPRVELFSGATTSFEALIRWQHPSRGLLGPGEFIDLAEETGLIIGIGALVIERVCDQLEKWQQASAAPLVPVSVNLSPRQFKSTDVADMVTMALKRHKLPASLLELEITESSVMEESAAYPGALRLLQEQGVSILVDDFGTGYSSLSRLHQLDFDVLKVDRIFTARLDQSPEGRVFFTAIVTMAHALGMRVVAEGVENAAQVKILQALLCDEIQGYFISRPLPPGATQPVFAERFNPGADG